MHGFCGKHLFPLIFIEKMGIVPSLKQHLNRGLKGKKKLMVKSVKAKASKSRKGPEAERHLVFLRNWDDNTSVGGP